MQACASARRWKEILQEYNQLEDTYSRKFLNAVSPSKSSSVGRGKGKDAMTWNVLIADYEASLEDRKLMTLLWPHVREMGYAKNERDVCVGYFAANVVLGLVSHVSVFEEDKLMSTLRKQDQKRATTQCRSQLKSLNLPSSVEDVANRLQTMIDGIETTFKTIIEMEERKSKAIQTPRKGKGRVALHRGVKSTPSKMPLKKMSSQGLVKESPLKRPREEAEDTNETEVRVLPTPKRVRIDSSIRSEIWVIEESEVGDAPPTSEAEVECVVQFPLFGTGGSNASTIADLPDEDAEEDKDMDAMEVDEPIAPSKRTVLAQAQETSRRRSKPQPKREVLEDVEGMDWPTLAAYRKRLIDARSQNRDTTVLSRERWRPVFPDREFWDKVAV